MGGIPPPPPAPPPAPAPGPFIARGDVADAVGPAAASKWFRAKS
eukprot:gene20851-15366_t